jgi:hypothetical protein
MCAPSIRNMNNTLRDRENLSHQFWADLRKQEAAERQVVKLVQIESNRLADLIGYETPAWESFWKTVADDASNVTILAAIQAEIARHDGYQITESEPFQNAVEAMSDVDFLAEEGHRPEMAAALAIEEQALTDLDRYIGEMAEI